MTAPKPKYWERASLAQLGKDLDYEGSTPVLVVGVLNRLLREVKELKARFENVSPVCSRSEHHECFGRACGCRCGCHVKEVAE